MVEKYVGDGNESIRGEIENEIANPHMDVPPLKAKWFVGQLPSKDDSLRWTEGLSGGAIIEMAVHGEEFSFRMVAVQSWWKDQ